MVWYNNYLSFIIDEHSVAGNGIEEVMKVVHILHYAGDKIVGFEDSSADFHVIISGEEHLAYIMSDILKITPSDKSWYVKWSATILALASVA